ncbi:N-acetyltransferase family protein [Phaeovulum sp.]|uniref:GNAT family N-acetyltransferase n=1 Tax=Phaeovulum sp. TaxID=2934796 RepID=UPI00356400D3
MRGTGTQGPLITRPATIADAAQMAALLNRIIEIGGTTAHQRSFDEARMTREYIAAAELISCTVADVGGEVLGFQALEWPHPKSTRMLPEGWAIIASFVRPGAQGRGIGQALWAATQAAAVRAQVRMIDATIRADNAAGLAYYSGLGFADYAVLQAIPLADGTPVDRIRKCRDPGQP